MFPHFCRKINLLIGVVLLVDCIVFWHHTLDQDLKSQHGVDTGWWLDQYGTSTLSRINSCKGLYHLDQTKWERRGKGRKEKEKSTKEKVENEELADEEDAPTLTRRK